MIKRLYIYLLFLAGIGLLTGCSPDGLPEETTGTSPEGLVDVRFNLTIAPEQIIQTDGDRVVRVEIRAATNVEQLKDLTILQFDKDENETLDDSAVKCVVSRWLRAPEPEPGETQPDGSAGKDYYLIGLQASEAKATQYLIFIANAGSIFQNYAGKTLKDFKEVTMQLDQKQSNGENLLMLAALYTPVKGVDDGLIYDVELQRLVAQVDFSYTTELGIINSSFTPLSLRLLNVPKVLKYADGIEEATDYPAKEEDNFVNYTAIVDKVKDGFSWYIPQNTHSEKGSAINSWEKTGENSNSSFCTYVELTGIYKASTIPDQLVLYKFFIGEDMIRDYNVYRNHHYRIDLTLKGVNSFDKRVNRRNLTLATPANCFVIPPEAGGEVSFNPYTAPGADVEESGVNYSDQVVENQYSRIARVGVVWQTSDNLVTASQDGALVRIQANTDGTAGNALVAAYDVDGTILWSWHVWVTPYAKVLDGTGINGYIYEFGGYKWMDRNLGALNTNRESGNRSLYYQWGRKDPFGAAGVTATNKGSALNINESVKEPTVFFTKQEATNTWHGGLAPVKNLWQEGVKTIFDPCPAGWRVPAFAGWGSYVWGATISWDTANPYGAALTIDGGGSYWFPIGALNLSAVFDGGNCYMWSAAWSEGVMTPGAYIFNSSNGSLGTQNGAYGGTVRCVKE